MTLLSLPNEGDLDAIEGWLGLDEGRRLAYLASIVPRGLAIVELGSWKGKSTCWLASGSRAGRGAPVYAVDHWQGSPEHRHLFTDPAYTTFPEFAANVERFGLADIVVPVTGKTVAVAEAWDKDVGLLFIDAAHEYEAVRADFLAWSPFVVAGGGVVFHDDSADGPRRVIEEFVLHSGAWGDFAHGPFSARKVTVAGRGGTPGHPAPTGPA